MELMFPAANGLTDEIARMDMFNTEFMQYTWDHEEVQGLKGTIFWEVAQRIDALDEREDAGPESRSILTEFMQQEGQGVKGTIFWKFAKRIAALVGREDDDVLALTAAFSTMQLQRKIQIMETLKKIR